MLQNTTVVVRNLIIINVLFFGASMLLGNEMAITWLAGTYPGLALFHAVANHYSHVHARGLDPPVLQHVCALHVWQSA